MRRFGVLGVVLAACNGGSDDKDTASDHTATPPGHTGEVVIPGDGDGDGVTADEDCDDTDPDIRPGIEERCDGVDTDCDPATADPAGTVGTSEGGAYETITQAVAEASPGATIWVCEGTFVEAVTIRVDLTVAGLGAVTVDAGGLGSAFDVIGGTVTLRDLAIVGGAGSPNGPAAENGGGVNAYQSSGPLTLERVTVTDCTAEYGGAVMLGAEGGTIVDCTFEGNVAGSHGAGLFAAGPGTVRGTTIRRNTAGGYGGAVGLGEDAEVEIFDSLLEGNDATRGGALFTFEGASVDLTGTVVQDNAASEGGGGLYLWDAEVVGGELLANVSDSEGGGVFVYEGGSLTDMRISENQAFRGAGMYLQGQVTLTGVTVDTNVATEEAGAAYLFGAVVDAPDTVFSQNTAVERGGGLMLVDSSLTAGEIRENDSALGGGVYISGVGTGPSQMSSTTIADNSVSGSGAGLFAATQFTLVGVTLSRNVSADRGGGLYATSGATGTITGTTIFGNAATERGGGVYPNAGSILLFETTEITSNTALRGAGFYINDNSSVTLTDSAVEANGDATTISGGGARVTSGTLVSIDSDWGEGPLDNMPDDVFVEVGQAAYIGYEADETFTCDEDACTPLP